MSATDEIPTPSSWVLFAISVVLGPGLILAGSMALDFVQSDSWKRVPRFEPVTAAPALDASGVVAYVERRGGDGGGDGRGCVFVVAVADATPPRKLGCAGDGTIPDPVGSLSWTDDGDLEVHALYPQPDPLVLPVGAGPSIPNAVPEVERTRGYRNDGTLVRLAEINEEAQISLQSVEESVEESVSGDQRVIATLDGPDSYQLGSPQWSPDGRWILVSDTEGRLLILSEDGAQIRALVPPDPGRRWIEEPLLTWHQGDTR